MSLPRKNAAATVPFGWVRAAGLGLTFRRIAEPDLPFLARVYASTRAEEMAAVATMTEAQKAAFLAAQFQLQHSHYQKYYPEADWLVTTRDGEDTGRLYIERWPSQHRIIDIAFLPEHRGRGSGEALLRDLMDEAAAAAKDVSIHVEKHNPAMRLYRRLGFVIEEDKGVYDLMRWTRTSASSPLPAGERSDHRICDDPGEGTIGESERESSPHPKPSRNLSSGGASRRPVGSGFDLSPAGRGEGET